MPETVRKGIDIARELGIKLIWFEPYCNMHSKNATDFLTSEEWEYTHQRAQVTIAVDGTECTGHNPDNMLAEFKTSLTISPQEDTITPAGTYLLTDARLLSRQVVNSPLHNDAMSALAIAFSPIVIFYKMDVKPTMPWLFIEVLSPQRFNNKFTPLETQYWEDNRISLTELQDTDMIATENDELYCPMATDTALTHVEERLGAMEPEILRLFCRMPHFSSMETLRIIVQDSENSTFPVFWRSWVNDFFKLKFPTEFMRRRMWDIFESKALYRVRNRPLEATDYKYGLFQNDVIGGLLWWAENAASVSKKDRTKGPSWSYIKCSTRPRHKFRDGGDLRIAYSPPTCSCPVITFTSVLTNEAEIAELAFPPIDTEVAKDHVLTLRGPLRGVELGRTCYALPTSEEADQTVCYHEYDLLGMKGFSSHLFQTTIRLDEENNGKIACDEYPSREWVTKNGRVRKSSSSPVYLATMQATHVRPDEEMGLTHFLVLADWEEGSGKGATFRRIGMVTVRELVTIANPDEQEEKVVAEREGECSEEHPLGFFAAGEKGLEEEDPRLRWDGEGYIYRLM